MTTDHNTSPTSDPKDKSPSPTMSFHDAGDPSMPTRASEAGSAPVLGALALELPLELERYRFDIELARGGMGAILRGVDAQFDRPLAFKVILEKYREHPQALRRFHNEAQITGQLQHPGIPPVHEVGQLPDGRPFFSMKLIQGEAFDRILAAREDLSEDLLRHIGVFEQICQTVGYAHAQRILHRDLKPNNVMVGEFGEVQVMDWGLAKHVDHGSQPEILIPAAILDGDQTALLDNSTQAGSILGTPAYLSPEQARGDIDDLDERSDVFGLGAILCEILTGSPPYAGTTTQHLHTRAAQGDLGDAFRRLDECGADRELIDLAKRCLAFDPSKRPDDGGAVAQAIGRYQENVRKRLRKAEISAAKAEEQRKRRRLLVVFGAFLLLVVAGIVTAAFWYQGERAEQREREVRAEEEARQKELERRLRREADQRREVQATVAKVRQAIDSARWTRARFMIDQTKQKLRNASTEVLRPLNVVSSEVALAEKLHNLRFAKSHVARSIGERSTANESYEKVFGEAGLDPFGDEALGRIAKRIRSSALRRHWLAALDDWGLAAKEDDQKRRILQLARLADPDPTRNEFRNLELLSDRNKLKARLDKLEADALPPEMWAVLGLRLQSLDPSKPPVDLYRKAQKEHPGDYWLNYLLANSLYTPNPAEAIGYYRAALAIQPESVGVLVNLSSALRLVGRTEESMALERKGLKLHPDNAGLNYNYGIALLQAQKPEEAIRHFEQALKAHPKSSPAWAELGLAYSRINEIDKAVECFEKAIEFDKKNVRARVRWAIVHNDRGQWQDAIRLAREAIAIAPKDVVALHLLADAYQKTKQWDEAIDTLKKLVPLDSKNFDMYVSLGKLLRQQKRLNETAHWLRIGTKSLPREGQLHAMLGMTYYELARFDEAIESLEECQRLLPRNSQFLPATRNHLRRLRELSAWDGHLRAIVLGKDKGLSPRDRLGAGYVAFRYRRRYRLSAEQYVAGLTADPKLADKVTDGHRFVAARAAVLTSRREGLDAENLTDKQQAEWRDRALAWLRADLEVWQARAARSPIDPDRKIVLGDWLTNEALAGVRDESALSKLPEEERKKWQELWAEVKKVYSKTRDR